MEERIYTGRKAIYRTREKVETKKGMKTRKGEGYVWLEETIGTGRKTI